MEANSRAAPERLGRIPGAAPKGRAKVKMLPPQPFLIWNRNRPGPSGEGPARKRSHKPGKSEERKEVICWRPHTRRELWSCMNAEN
jgi:hypothetical protein